MKSVFYGVSLMLCFFKTLSAQPTTALSLDDAITMALNNNPKILAAQKEIDAADGRILQAGRISNPEFGVSWNEAPSFNIGKAGERDIGVSQQIEYPSTRFRKTPIPEIPETEKFSLLKPAML